MWTSTLLKRFCFTFQLLFMLLGLWVPKASSQHFPNSTIDANYPGLSSDCALAVDPVLDCDDVLADISLTNPYLSDGRLTSLCTSECIDSLKSAQLNINATCTSKSDVIIDQGITYPASYVIDKLSWSYQATCRKDGTTGAYCHAILRDWAMANTTNLTAEQQCSDCMLGVTQIELSSPFEYDNNTVAAFSSSASACGKTTYTITQPTPYALPNANASASATPTANPGASISCSEQYQIAAGDTCQSVSVAHNVSTFGLLYWNNLAVGCTDFPGPGKSVCLPSPCPIYTVQKEDSCMAILAQHAPNYSTRQLRSWNLNINNICSNLDDLAGTQICIGPPASLARVSPTGTGISPTTTPIATAVPVPNSAEPASNHKCGVWYTVISGDTCDSVCGQYNIGKNDFYFLNPGVNRNCSNLELTVSYCVAPVGDITSYPGYNGGSGTATAPCDAAFPEATCYQNPATLSQVPFLEHNATWARLPNTPINTTSISRPTKTPMPTAPGSQSGCDDSISYIHTGDPASDKSANLCRQIASFYAITVDQLVAWNPSLDIKNCTLQPGYSYCLSGPVVTSSVAGNTLSPTTTSLLPTPTTTPLLPTPTLSATLPGPTQAGIVPNCNKYAVQHDNVYCTDLAKENGIDVSQLYQWNPALKGDCSGMWPGYAYCVGVSSH